MTRLDQTRAISLISEKSGAKVEEIENKTTLRQVLENLYPNKRIIRFFVSSLQEGYLYVEVLILG